MIKVVIKSGKIDMILKAQSACVTRLLPSPNFGERAAGKSISMVVLHYTGMESSDAALKRLCTVGTDVSCHYVVMENGDVLQLVDEQKRAWHAGKSYWQGERDINSVSIGIEIVNGGHDFGLPDYPDVQIAASVALLKDICARHVILPQRILGHSDIAPQRKEDPGEKFPWHALAKAGLGVPMPLTGLTFASQSDLDEERALKMLSEMGYDVHDDISDEQHTKLWLAFQRRFLPQHLTGAPDALTRQVLQDLMLYFKA